MAKILHVCGLDSFVGAIQPLLEALIEQGHEVHCACTDTGFFSELRERKIHMIHIPVVRKLTAPSNLKTVYSLFRLIRREKYDIVHVHNPIASMLGRLAARLAGCRRIVYTSHGFYFHENMSPLKYRLFYQVEKWLTRLCTDSLFLVSREDYEVSVAGKFKQEENLHYVSNGVDVSHRYNPDTVQDRTILELKSSLGIREGDRLIGFVGRLVQEKGIVELIEAFRRLKSSHPRAKLLLIGEVLQGERDLSMLRMLPELAEDGILQVGYRKDIPAFLALCDIFVLPSHREGMPLSILEAMAMGKPIVTTDIRGCREEVDHGHNGFVVPVRDPQALFLRFDELLRDEAKIRSFSLESRRRAVDHYDIQSVLQNQLGIYSKLLSEPHAPALVPNPTYHSQ